MRQKPWQTKNSRGRELGENLNSRDVVAVVAEDVLLRDRSSGDVEVAGVRRAHRPSVPEQCDAGILGDQLGDDLDAVVIVAVISEDVLLARSTARVTWNVPACVGRISPGCRRTQRDLQHDCETRESGSLRESDSFRGEPDSAQPNQIRELDLRPRASAERQRETPGRACAGAGTPRRAPRRPPRAAGRGRRGRTRPGSPDRTCRGPARPAAAAATCPATSPRPPG